MSAIQRRDPRRLGDTLRELIHLDDDEVEHAAQVAKATGQRIGEVLESTGVITAEQKQRALGQQWGVPFVDLGDYAFSEAAITSVPERLFRGSLLTRACDAGAAESAITAQVFPGPRGIAEAGPGRHQEAGARSGRLALLS